MMAVMPSACALQCVPVYILNGAAFLQLVLSVCYAAAHYYYKTYNRIHRYTLMRPCSLSFICYIIVYTWTSLLIIPVLLMIVEAFNTSTLLSLLFCQTICWTTIDWSRCNCLQSTHDVCPSYC
jgi:hypothetical protein